MTEARKLRLGKFKKAILAGKNQTQAAIESGAPAHSAHVQGSKMMKEPEVRNALEAAFRRLGANEDYLATKLIGGAEALKPGVNQLEYLDRIAEKLGYGQKDAAPDGANTFNVLALIQQHGLVGENGKAIEAKDLVEP